MRLSRVILSREMRYMIANTQALHHYYHSITAVGAYEE
jgi:hypothetical protein